MMTREAIKAAIPHREPFLLLDEIVEQTDEPDRLPQDVSPATSSGFAGTIRTFRSRRACCCAKRRCRPGRCCWQQASRRATGSAGRDADERREVQAHGPARRHDRDRSRADERLADAFFLNAKVTCDGKTAVTFDFACTLTAQAVSARA